MKRLSGLIMTISLLLLAGCAYHPHHYHDGHYNHARHHQHRDIHGEHCRYEHYHTQTGYLVPDTQHIEY